MEYGQCLRCKQYRMNPNQCQCKLFLAWLGEDEMTENDAHELYATDASEAAEKFCNEYDAGGDYTIIGRGHAEVWVKDLEDKITKFQIDAYPTPNYHASEIV